VYILLRPNITKRLVLYFH